MKMRTALAVLTLWLCRNHDLPHRLLFRPGGQNAGGTDRPDAIDLAQSVWCRLDDVKDLVTEGAHKLLGIDQPTPRIIPEERYFSMPSAEVGGDVRRNRALNCWPRVRSLTHSPEAVIHSPAEMLAAWPTTVTTSR